VGWAASPLAAGGARVAAGARSSSPASVARFDAPIAAVSGAPAPPVSAAPPNREPETRTRAPATGAGRDEEQEEEKDGGGATLPLLSPARADSARASLEAKAVRSLSHAAASPTGAARAADAARSTAPAGATPAGATPAPGVAARFHVRVRAEGARGEDDVVFFVSRSTRFSKLVRAWCGRHEVAEGRARFSYGGSAIAGDCTLASLCFGDGDDDDDDDDREDAAQPVISVTLLP
jgi:hypothetical protein